MEIYDRIDKALYKYKFYSVINSDISIFKPEKTIEEEGRLVQFKRKEIIFHEGSSPNEVFIIKSGKVKISQLSEDGNTQILFIFSEGEIFGFRPILCNENNPTSAIALENCELNVVSKEKFLSYVNSSHAFCQQLLINLSHEYSVFVNRLNFSSHKGIKEKVALSLLLLHDKFKRQGSENAKTEITITRSELAQYVGTSLENLVRNLKYFKEEKLIEIEGKVITINNPEQILQIASIE